MKNVIMNRHLEPDEDYGDDCHYYDDEVDDDVDDDVDMELHKLQTARRLLRPTWAELNLIFRYSTWSWW